MQANLKNLIIGIILGLALGLALSATADKNAEPINGRYQIAAHAYYPHYVVLDTRTGDVYTTTYHGKKDELYHTRFLPDE